MNNKLIKIIKIKYAYIISFILLAFFIFNACSNDGLSNNPIVFSGLYFDTFVTITIYDKADNTIKENLNDLCNKYDLLFSTENPESELYKINHSSNSPVIVSDEMLEVINDSIYYAKLSNGLLDPSIESISSLWNFTEDNKSLPDENSIKEKLKTVDYNNIVINNNTITLLNNSKIGLGYIAKGYIADKILEYLKNNNIENCIINLGGNILVNGHKNNNLSFNLGIEKPFTNGEVIYKISNNNSKLSLVTSGVSKRYFEYQNKIYHHILDVKTGYPVTNNVYSVTITGPSSETCDALSTYLFILGKEEGLKYINNLKDYEALYIMDNYSIYKSDNFAGEAN